MKLSFLFNLITVFILAGLLLIVYIKNRKNRMNQSFALFSLFLIQWLIASALADVALSEEAAIFWVKLAIIGPFFASPLFFYFCSVFPGGKSRLKRKQLFLLFLPAFVILPLIPTSANIESIRLESWGTAFTPGRLYYVLDLFFVFYLGAGIWKLKKTYQKSKHYEERLQIRYFFIGFLLLLAVGFTTNSLLPLLLDYSKASIYGPAIAVLLFCTFTTYAIIKHHLLDIKVVAAELFLAGFVLCSLLFTVSALSWQSMLFRASIWLPIDLLGFLLVHQVLRDVKQQQEIISQARELQQQNLHLQELIKQKTDFLTVASHILNTPLSKIRGYVSLILEDRQISMTTRKYADIIRLASEQMVNLVKKFQSITDLQSGPPVLNPKELNMPAIVRNVVDELLPVAKKYDIAVLNQVSSDFPFVFADEQAVAEILKALVENAIRYNKPGGKVVIQSTLNSRKKLADLIIEDTGIGLDREAKSQIFHSISFRSKEALSLYADGTGMSLYKAALLADYSNGILTASSNGKGRGSRFVLSLPLA